MEETVITECGHVVKDAKNNKKPQMAYLWCQQEVTVTHRRTDETADKPLADLCFNGLFNTGFKIKLEIWIYRKQQRVE